MSTFLAKTAVLVLTCHLALGSSTLWAASPLEEVKGVVDEVIRLLKDPALMGPAKKQERRRLIKNVVDRRFDYEEMAKRTLGVTWGRLNRAQRQEFVNLFGELLEASYADKIEKYQDEKVVYLGEHLEGDYAEVRTMLIRRNDKIPMNYRLLNKTPWMVYDVVVEGVSLVSNYRAQFSRVISESSYPELVKRLRNKVDELQRMEKNNGPA